MKLEIVLEKHYARGMRRRKVTVSPYGEGDQHIVRVQGSELSTVHQTAADAKFGAEVRTRALQAKGWMRK